MARRGRKRNLNREEEHWKLLLAEIGPIVAAKRVGIGHTTGHRWRSQHGRNAPLRISRRLGRSPSTISRELRRNMRKHDRASTTLSWPTLERERWPDGCELGASGKTSSNATWSRTS